MDRSRRYEDGEVRRYGAGESYRPYNRDRSPRPARSPPRSMRSPARDRGRTPPGGSDSYVPGRSPPRRRSRSNDRFRRRERSRDPEPWRRRERSRSRPRSPIRRNSPPPRQRSPMRRSPPHFASPRRDERRDDRRDERDERPRSPRRHFDNRDVRPRSRSPFDRDRAPRRNRSPFRRSPPAGPRGGSYRPRSRSIDRRGDREDRYAGPPFRRPSIPPRDSVNSSAINSRSASGKSSPRPTSRRGFGSRSRPHTPARGSPTTRAASPTPVSAPPKAPSEPADRDLNSSNNNESYSSLDHSEPRDSADSRQQTRDEPPKQTAQQEDVPRPPRSPPKAPAALRAPPTGPASSRNFTSPAPQHAQPHRPAQTPTGPSRADITSPTNIPPAGPRGYVPPSRGGGGFGGGRGGRGGGGWSNNNINPRHVPGPSVSPTIPPTGPSGIPTGPRAGATNPPSTTSSPSLGGGGGNNSSNNTNNNTSSGGPKPFNPPTGPASHSHSHGGHSHGHHHAPPRQPLSLAQSLITSMPPIIPGGRPDPSESHIALGITKELEPHFRKLIEDEERQREELRIKQEKLRKNLKIWDRMERESKAFELKSDLSEKSLRALAGEGSGGPSF